MYIYIYNYIYVYTYIHTYKLKHTTGAESHPFHDIRRHKYTLTISHANRIPREIDIPLGL